MIDLVPAKLTHVGPLAANMRAIDRMEAEAMGRTPKDALRIGLRTSLSSYTALEDGKPAAMMGVVSTSLISGTAIVWMLGTPSVYRHGRDLLRLGPPILDRWLETFRALENVVYVGNEKAIRLLVKWGFHVGGEITIRNGVSFVPFKKERAAP